MYVNTYMQNKLRAELEANRVCDLCGNSEIRMFQVAEYLGIDHQNSWFIAATRIAGNLNDVADPAETLEHILTQI
jgi:hypothetical protein